MAYTIPAAAQWPSVLMRERATRWTPDFGNESSPPALDGTRQFRNTNGGGLWRAAFIGGQLQRREHVLAWNATEILLRGGMTPVDVPVCAYRPRRVTSHIGILFESVGGWAARAISGRVSIRKAVVGDLIAGMYFSDYDAGVYGNRLYRIETATPFLATALLGDEEQYDITFWPPARKSIVAGHNLEVEDCFCVMRLAESGSMDLELELRKRGNPNAEFIEAF